MAKLNVQQIRNLARTIIAENPGGIRYSVLINDNISPQSPETPRSTIGGAVYNLDTLFTDEISKPSRGLYVPVARSGNDIAALGSAEQVAGTGIKVRETDFYEPFALWLKNDLDEVTEVRSLGGAGLK
ncbi:MAG: hypothetical protein EXQ56_05135 [Acidobacteria bacterium]|nr:hypothetical protein [Acidobacteriota bacterium]